MNLARLKREVRSVLPFHLAITLIGSFGTIILLTILDNDLSSFLPARTLVLTLEAISVSLLVGLPIRFSTTLHSWWVRRPFFSLTGVFSGLVLVFLSWLPYIKTKRPPGADTGPPAIDPLLSFAGWALICFFLLHWYPAFLLRRNYRQK